MHFPIVDVRVPTEAKAHATIADLMKRRDQAIVIHCNGGLGRSGLVAGCLLRALGVDAADTLKRLVAARGPGCPQTDAQRAFVRSFAL